MLRPGQYDPENSKHRRIITLLAQGLSKIEVAERVGVAVITVRRVRYCERGKAAFLTKLDEIDEQTIKLYSAGIVLKAL